MALTDRPLQGIGVLVTRPARQAEKLCRLIEELGGTAVRFPTLEILETSAPGAVQTIIDRFDDFQIAIFTSANAVERAIPLIRIRRSLPLRLVVAAVGKATARKLEQLGAPAHLIPETFNSEALLAMPELQAVKGQKIIIFRGEGGRELLGDTLQERGAQVAYAEVYRRVKPAADSGWLVQCWKHKEIQVAVVTSNESLRNLFELVGERGQPWLIKTPLLVVSERAQRLARELGFSQPPLLAKEASDEAIVETLRQWRRGHLRRTLEP